MKRGIVLNSFGLCVAAMTGAARAKSILSKNGISASIHKSDCGIKYVGCSYEVAVPREQFQLAADILTKNGIKLLK